MASGVLFDIPQKRSSKESDLAVAKKTKAKVNNAPITIKGGGGIVGRISQIKSMVNANLGQYKEEYQVIQDKELLHDFITECIGNSYISIDTETTGLDPLLDTLVGICPYTYGQKGSYIPLNHISYITQARVDNQLSMDFVMSEFKRLLDKKLEIDMFNASFDIRFLRANGLGDIYCTWDGFLASKILNENEPTANLKALHNKYCLDGKGDAFRFDDLFKGIPFSMIPIDVGFLYAAHDPVITTELCDYQRLHLRDDSDREDIRDMYWVFKNIEMPCVQVICDMEDIGIAFDTEYNRTLQEKYHKELEEKVQAFYDVCDKYSDKIEEYKLENIDHKLDDPINISSPTQLSVLFYDILGIETVDKKNPRGTGVDILSKMDNPIAKAVLEYRALEKLTSTYIDKLPECINPNDGRIHCKFNQYGAKTSRMSSSDPNMQNIPSHNKDIRKVFTATDGYVLMSSDFSQQEPKCLAALCYTQLDDKQLMDIFLNGKDLYAEIASKSFNRPYEDCLEFYLDENGNKTAETNVDGKERRSQAKKILLGVLYGRGTASVAEQLGCSTEKAQVIKDSVFKAFPAIKKFEETSLEMARELGYVTTVCGTKRRLPELQLDEFEFHWKSGSPPDTDILDFTELTEVSDTVPPNIANRYLPRLKRARSAKEKQNIIWKASSDGIYIVDNGGKIADATRQCVNSRIQGSAANLTKLAMIHLNNHPRLKELGFRLLIPVHDEVIAECPQENAKECAQLLAETMSKAAEEILKMPISCDVAISKCWYGEELDVDTL